MSYYTETNFKSKKALKEAVAAGTPVAVWHRGSSFYGLGGHALEESKTRPVQVALEGPHYPKPHSWYASARIFNGVIVQGTVK